MVMVNQMGNVYGAADYAAQRQPTAAETAEAKAKAEAAAIEAARPKTVSRPMQPMSQVPQAGWMAPRSSAMQGVPNPSFDQILNGYGSTQMSNPNPAPAVTIPPAPVADPAPARQTGFLPSLFQALNGIKGVGK